MKKIVGSLFLVASVALLSACGGGDDEVADSPSVTAGLSKAAFAATSPTDTTPMVPAVMVAPTTSAEPVPPFPSTVPQPEKVADVTFTNVPTVRSLAVQGQRSIEIAAFRTVWNSASWKPVQQLVFQNVYDDSADSLFDQQSVQLVDGHGDINSRDTHYSIRFEGKRVVVDFLYGWRAQNTPIPQTYSLKANLRTDTATGKKFAMELIGVQMHDFEATSSGVVAGGFISVVTVEGKGLPTITSTSLNYLPDTIPGNVYSVDITVSCPETNTYACVGVSVKFLSNGQIQNQGFFVQVDGSIGSNQLGVYLQPGQTSTFTLNVYTPHNYLWISMIDAEFDVGGTLVSPIRKQNCESLVGDSRNCKG